MLRFKLDNIRPIKLASNAQTWREMDQTIEDSVSQVCGNFDAKTVEAFLFLTDILTNEDIDRIDRYSATLTVQKLAFTYSPEFEKALEAYLDRINPGRTQLRKAS